MNMRTMAFAVALALAQGTVWANGVTRSVEPVSGGCKVTLAWTFSGTVESDLVIEERLAPGWSVDTTTVPFGSLDATSFSGSVARFAVKPSLLSADGSISFVVRPDAESASGTVAGDWQMYLSGALQKGNVAAESRVATLSVASENQVGSGTESLEEAEIVETAVAIKSFRVVDGSRIELSYAALAKSGTLVVEGCEGLGKAWKPVKSKEDVPAGDGTVVVEKDEAGECRFYRMKLLTKEVK